MIVRLWWVKNTGHFPQVRVQVSMDATDNKKEPKVSPCLKLSYKIIILDNERKLYGLVIYHPRCLALISLQYHFLDRSRGNYMA